MSETERWVEPNSGLSTEYSPDARVAEAKLIEMIRNAPEIAQYVTRDTIARAKAAFDQIDGIVTHPQIQEEIQAMAPGQTDKIRMLVLPNLPLVITRSDGLGITATAPVLTCTLYAMEDVREPGPQTYGYYLAESVQSDAQITKWVWETAKKNPRAMWTYDSRNDNPEDYVATATSGMFWNEVFMRVLSSDQFGL